AHLSVFVGDFFYAGCLLIENVLDLLVHAGKLLHQLLPQCSSNRAFELRQFECEQLQYGELCRECLRAGDTNFRTGMGVNAGIRDTRNGGAHHIDNTEDGRTFTFGIFQSHESICRFSTLRQGDDHIVCVYNRIAVPKLRSVFDFDIQPAQFLDNIFPDEGRMPAGTTGQHDDTARGLELIRDLIEATEGDAVVLHIQAPTQGILYRCRLVIDLFEHKMFISPLFYCRKLQVQLLDEWCKPFVPEVFQYQLFGAYDRQFVIIDINHLFGIAQHRRSIRTEEMFALSDADDQRASL